MIVNPKETTSLTHKASTQRLGDKALFTTLVPNADNVYVRYFSGVDAEIYFEDIYIDEAVSISYKVQQNAYPIYGYNSYVFDDIAVGNRFVKGMFTVNFTRSNYMYNVLDVLTKYKYNTHATTTSISSEKPLWKNGFDIYLSYGDAKSKINGSNANSSVTVIKNITLLSCEQQFDSSGMPILETYEFVAQDIDWLSDTSTTISNTTTTDNTPNFTVSMANGQTIFEFDKATEILYLSYEMDGCGITETVYDPETSGSINKTDCIKRSYSSQTLRRLKELLADEETVTIDIELTVRQDGAQKSYSYTDKIIDKNNISL
jgi:hypothetical protein